MEKKQFQNPFKANPIIEKRPEEEQQTKPLVTIEIMLFNRPQNNLSIKVTPDTTHPWQVEGLLHDGLIHVHHKVGQILVEAAKRLESPIKVVHSDSVPPGIGENGIGVKE